MADERSTCSTRHPQIRYADFVTAAEMRLKLFYHCSKEALQSLRVVEYLGPETLETCYNSNNVKVKVQVYALFHTPRSLEEQKDFPEAETTQMPHAAFEGNWDE